jgi:predicted dehydrogenase
LIKARPDILCIAGPDETHAGLAEAALAHPPRLILCEKPLGSDFAAIARLVAAATQARVPLAVNFPRRWLPGVASWLGDAKAGRHGDPVAACVIYCRGLRHNACHGLDLVGAAFGSDGVTARRLAGAVDDFASSDPTVSGTLTVKGPTGSVTITVTGVDGRRANLFETDILFTGGRLRVWNEGGIRWQIFGPGPAAAHGGRELHVIQQSHDNPPRHMLAVWRNIADHLSKGQPLLCGAPDTLAGSALVEAIAQAPPLPL